VHASGVIDREGILHAPDLQEVCRFIVSAPGLPRGSSNAEQWCSEQFAGFYQASRKVGLLALIRSSIIPPCDSSSPSFPGPTPDRYWIEFDLNGRAFHFGPNVRGFLDELPGDMGEKHYRRSRVSEWDYRTMLKALGRHDPDAVGQDDTKPPPLQDLYWMGFLAACALVENGSRTIAQLTRLSDLASKQPDRSCIRNDPEWTAVTTWFDDVVRLCRVTGEFQKFRSPLRILGHDVLGTATEAQGALEYLRDNWGRGGDSTTLMNQFASLREYAGVIVAWGQALGLLVHADDLPPKIIRRFMDPVPFEVVRRIVGPRAPVHLVNKDPCPPGALYLIAQCARNALTHGASEVTAGWKIVEKDCYVWIVDNGGGVCDPSGELLAGEVLRKVFGQYSTKTQQRGGWGLFGSALMTRRFRGDAAVFSGDGRSQATYPRDGQRVERYLGDLSLTTPSKGTAFVYRMDLADVPMAEPGDGGYGVEGELRSPTV
jgi:hypothetical protein